MFLPDILATFDNLSIEEALQRPLDPNATPARRVAALLGGEGSKVEPTTVGDALFRWARTEPDALDEADIPALRHVSSLLEATGRIPKRFSMGADLKGAALAGEANLYGRAWADPRSYMLARLVAHLHDAQGCETAIGYAGGDPCWVLINSLNFAVQDPSAGPPSTIERLILVPQDMLGTFYNNPMVFPLLGITSSALGDILPSVSDLDGLLWTGFQVCLYASATAQAARLIMRQDTDALLKASSIASTAATGHLGHVAGHAAAVGLFGLAGSWMIVLAPIASGLAGRVVARNLGRRARFLLFCRQEVKVLHDAIKQHCTAAKDVLEGNMRSTHAQAKRFAGMHAAANNGTKPVIADWLDRIEHIQSYRKLLSSQLDNAIGNPTTLDRRDADPLAAAHESLLICARAGIHPANVTRTSAMIVSASTALHGKMSSALI